MRRSARACLCLGWLVTLAGCSAPPHAPQVVASSAPTASAPPVVSAPVAASVAPFPECAKLRAQRRTTWLENGAGTGLGGSVTVPAVSAARVAQLRASLGASFKLEREGDLLRLTAEEGSAAGATADGELLVTQRPLYGEVDAQGLTSSSHWQMNAWLESWHSNVGGAPGRLTVLVPPAGDSLLVSCEADHGLETVSSERVVEQSTGRVRAETPEHRLQWVAAYSPDGAKVLLVFQDQEWQETVLLIDAASGAKEPVTLRGRLRWATGHTLVSDGACPD